MRRGKFIRLFAGRFLEIDSTGVMILDERFRMVEVSDMICDLFGLDKAIWCDRPVEEWFDFAGWKPHPFDRSLFGGLTFRNRSFEYEDSTGLRSFMLDGEVLRNEDNGEIAGAFVLFRDVSHLILLEEQIRRSDRLRTIGEIAAGTAHEIRNPLTAMRGFMQLLQKSVSDRDMVKEQQYVAIMMSELDRVKELVDEFLLLGKPKEVRLQSVRPGVVLQEIIPVIRSEALLYGVTVHYESKPDIPPVWVDKEQLKQVFLNLAKNAIEAMNGGGSLTIREKGSADKSGFAGVEIVDTGPGIPSDVIGRIFDPFFTTKSQGTGLGLSICQRIVHDLGGLLEAASDAHGTRFTVWLPPSV